MNVSLSTDRPPSKSSAEFVPPWRRMSLAGRGLRWLRYHAQWLFLIGLAAVGFLLWSHVKDASEIPAYAMARTYRVGSQLRGVIAEVSVVEGQRVKKGQVVARLDSSLLDADIAVARAKVEQLQSQLSSTKMKFEMDRLKTNARIGALADSASQGLLTGWTDLRQWRAELAALNHEIGWQEKLRKSHLGRAAQMGRLKARQQALVQRIKSAPMHLGLYRKKSKNAKVLLEKLQGGLSHAQMLQSLLEPIRMQLKMQHLTIGRLELQKAKLVLRAPVSGLVKSISQRERAPVSASAPVLTIVEEKPRHVIAYIRDTSARSVRVGARVTVEVKAKRSSSFFGLLGDKKTYRGKVVGLGPIAILPGRFRDYIRRPIWARPVTIKLAGQPDLIPGERMHITIHGDAR